MLFVTWRWLLLITQTNIKDNVLYKLILQMWITFKLAKKKNLSLLWVFFGRGTSCFSALAGAGRVRLPEWLSRKQGGNSATHGAGRADGCFTAQERGWLVLPGTSQGGLATKMCFLLNTSTNELEREQPAAPARAGGWAGCLRGCKSQGWGGKQQQSLACRGVFQPYGLRAISEQGGRPVFLSDADR